MIHFKIHIVAGSEQWEPLDNFDVRTATEARKGAPSADAGQRRTGDPAEAEAGGTAESESCAQVESSRQFWTEGRKDGGHASQVRTCLYFGALRNDRLYLLCFRRRNPWASTGGKPPEGTVVRPIRRPPRFVDMRTVKKQAPTIPRPPPPPRVMQQCRICLYKHDKASVFERHVETHQNK